MNKLVILIMLLVLVFPLNADILITVPSYALVTKDDFGDTGKFVVFETLEELGAAMMLTPPDKMIGVAIISNWLEYNYMGVNVGISEGNLTYQYIWVLRE